MGPTEFSNFLTEHTKRFPSLGNWLDENDAQDAWYQDTFAELDFADAIYASKQMANGEVAAGGFGGHPAVIYQFCKQLAMERDAAPLSPPPGRRFWCPHCQDMGIVSVVNAAFFKSKALRKDGSIDVRMIKPIAVACSCSRGDRYADPPRVNNQPIASAMPRLNDRMFPMAIPLWTDKEPPHGESSEAYEQYCDFLDWYNDRQQQHETRSLPAVVDFPTPLPTGASA